MTIPTCRASELKALESGGHQLDQMGFCICWLMFNSLVLWPDSSWTLVEKVKTNFLLCDGRLLFVACDVSHMIALPKYLKDYAREPQSPAPVVFYNHFEHLLSRSEDNTKNRHCRSCNSTFGRIPLGTFSGSP